jgi:hypothetical protein
MDENSKGHKGAAPIKSFESLCSKKLFQTEKNRALLCALFKILNIFAYNSEKGRDIPKIQTDFDSADSKQSFCIKFFLKT